MPGEEESRPAPPAGLGVPSFMGADSAALAALLQASQQSGGDATASLIAMTAAAAYAGPLPPPDILRGYEDVLPGSADRIFKMAETQSTHRQSLEAVAVNGGHRRSWWGLWLGFASTLVVMGLGAAMVFTGHDAAGAAVMGIDVVGLAGVFVYAQQSQRREREAKASISQLPAIRPPQPPAT